MKILIVDDSLLERKLLSGVLKKLGVEHEILQAVDGEDAIQVLGNHYQDIGLILLDWQMPKMNGIEFMKAVIKVPAVSHIPIVMVTASGSEDNKREARQTNPKLAGYIVKPYKPETVIETIKPFLKISTDKPST